jgi:hypothetical protein
MTITGLDEKVFPRVVLFANLALQVISVTARRERTHTLVQEVVVMLARADN